MNNINKVRPIIKENLFILLEKLELNEIKVDELVKLSNISRAAFYKNYKNLDEIIFDYFNDVFSLALEICAVNPYAIRTNLGEILENILINKEKFIILQKRNLIILLDSFFKKNFDYSYFGNNFKTDLFIGVVVAVINSWIKDNFTGSIEDMIEILSKVIVFNQDVLHLPKQSEFVLSTKTMRESDGATIISGVNSKELMQRAAKGVFDSYRWKGRVAIVCGKGNNAGDGYALALILAKRKINVEILRIDDSLSKDGEFYFSLVKGMNIPYKFINESYSFDSFDIIVDAIFGTGFKGDVKEPYYSIINNINCSKAHIISIDINSGLNGDNGLCNIAIKSNLTVSIGNLKSGLFLSKAKDYVETIKNVDIGIKPINLDYKIIGTDDVNLCIPKREQFSNKGSYGYVTLIGGSSLYSGAVRLSSLSLSTLKMGAGVSILATPKSISESLVQRILESTVYPLDECDGFIKFNKEQIDYLIKRSKTIAFGMGLGINEEVNKTLSYLIDNFTGNLIIDADGLSALATFKEKLKSTNAKIILTPHLKEFSRLINKTSLEILEDPINIAKEFAFTYKCILLLKGPTTIVTDGKEVLLTNRGTSGMATAGSGDVLSGIIAGIVSYNEHQLLLATCSAAYINGVAGEVAEIFSSDISMTSLDTLNNISKVITIIRNN